MNQQATNSGFRIGIDLGGTKIEIVALAPDGHETLRRREATPVGDYHQTLTVIRSMVDAAERDLRSTASVGIGTPGAVSKVDGCIKNSNSVCLNGQPLLSDLCRVLGRDIRIANDADCFALSEATDGAASDGDVVFGVILGTGVGAGVVANGRLLAGPNGITGEWGHNPLPWMLESETNLRQCYCGNSNCIETFLSGSGLSKTHEANFGVSIPAVDIVQGAENGQSQCISSLDAYSDRLARSLSHVINLLDPDVIVLGGGLSNCEFLYQSVPKTWGKYVFSDRVDTRLVAPKHGDSSGVRGAAWLWGPNDYPIPD